MPDSIFTAATFGSLDWAAKLSTILHSASAGIDPELGKGFPQLWPFSGHDWSRVAGVVVAVRKFGCCYWKVRDAGLSTDNFPVGLGTYATFDISQSVESPEKHLCHGT